MMPAYLIAEHTITDAKTFEEYRVKVAPTIAKHVLMSPERTLLMALRSC